MVHNARCAVDPEKRKTDKNIPAGRFTSWIAVLVLKAVFVDSPPGMRQLLPLGRLAAKSRRSRNIAISWKVANGGEVEIERENIFEGNDQEENQEDGEEDERQNSFESDDQEDDYDEDN